MPLDNLGFATFDAAGRVASVANGNGSNTRFTYDSGGNLATVLDAVGNMTQWVYNAEGQVTEEINALGDSRYFVYNEDGLLARHTDRNGRVWVYEYDDQQRVTAEIWYANAADADAAANPVNTIHFAYLCPCQLRFLDFVLALPACCGTEKRVGGAGGGRQLNGTGPITRNR